MSEVKAEQGYIPGAGTGAGVGVWPGMSCYPGMGYPGAGVPPLKAGESQTRSPGKGSAAALSEDFNQYLWPGFWPGFWPGLWPGFWGGGFWGPGFWGGGFWGPGFGFGFPLSVDEGKTRSAGEGIVSAAVKDELQVKQYIWPGFWGGGFWGPGFRPIFWPGFGLGFGLGLGLGFFLNVGEVQAAGG